jgi:hypothetical protein
VRNTTPKPADLDPSPDGELAPGDACEPQRIDDAAFEPAEREQVPPTPTKPTNPFSREALRLDQNYTAALGLQEHIHNIAVDKPPSEVWFRVHPDRNERGEEMIFDTYLLHLKNGPDRGVYQVSATLLPLLSGEKALKPTRLVLCVDRQKELRFWPLRLPGPDGREDEWMSSALAIAEQAKHEWVRMVAGASGYKSLTSSADLPEPIWPTQSLDELLELAFKKRRIASENDPVFRRLREGQ